VVQYDVISTLHTVNRHGTAGTQNLNDCFDINNPKFLTEHTATYRTGGDAFQLAMLLLYEGSDGDSDEVFGHVPHEWIDGDAELLLVDQITKGLGVKDVWHDPGSIISQDIVGFRTSGSRKLILVSPSETFRGLRNSSVGRSYSSSVMWSFDIIARDGYGVVVNMSDFAFAPAGFGHSSLDLGHTIAKVYNFKHDYNLDRTRSRVNPHRCAVKPGATSVELDFTYSQASTTTAVSSRSAATSSSSSNFDDPNVVLANVPLSSFLTISLRRTFLKLDYLSSSDDRSEGQYKPRRYHPKSGFNAISYMNESAGLLSPRDEHFIVRHHLYLPSTNNSIYTATATLTTSAMTTMTETTAASSDFTGIRSRRANLDALRSGPRAFLASSADASVNAEDVVDATTDVDVIVNLTSGAKGTIASLAINPILGQGQGLPQLLYLIDSKAPSPIQEALVEGVAWWDEAFQYVSRYLAL
jgi:hypothetical protein